MADTFFYNIIKYIINTSKIYGVYHLEVSRFCSCLSYKLQSIPHLSNISTSMKTSQTCFQELLIRELLQWVSFLFLSAVFWPVPLWRGKKKRYINTLKGRHLRSGWPVFCQNKSLTTKVSIQPYHNCRGKEVSTINFFKFCIFFFCVFLE